jgi:NAD(P)-dependent dehydrogenase (short-subunit alcohol dehydrogenase family)
MGINHYGHFYLTSLLFNILKESDDMRIVNVSSLAHKFMMPFKFTFNMNFEDMHFSKGNYRDHVAYSYSKLANVMFTK